MLSVWQVVNYNSALQHHPRITDAEDEELATPSAARLLLYLYVQRNMYKIIQRNILKVWFDYCCVHVSTVISHVSQQFRFLVFLIVAIRNHVDNHKALLPVDAAQFGDCKSKSKKTRKLWGEGKYKCEVKYNYEGYALGYASGKILKISNFLKYSPRLYPQAMPQGK
ncbi:hypothetical protein T02_12898 [Trichinella nativa]|uniref:Uncharacterized protein n=1 Tax=Trichinella nativa TaxID=6335 RepID=A0A0V1L2W2_9BILA|nr:hypothetical protein T02_12898 [Trichinella nativa]